MSKDVLNASTTRSLFACAHMGLLPAVEYYESCVKGWDQYVKGSLLQLLTENIGQPG